MARGRAFFDSEQPPYGLESESKVLAFKYSDGRELSSESVWSVESRVLDSDSDSDSGFLESDSGFWFWFRIRKTRAARARGGSSFPERTETEREEPETRQKKMFVGVVYSLGLNEYIRKVVILR